MAFSDVLKAGNYKKVLLSVYEEYLYPGLKEFVASTENSYDDAALGIVDGFLRDFLKSE